MGSNESTSSSDLNNNKTYICTGCTQALHSCFYLQPLGLNWFAQITTSLVRWICLLGTSSSVKDKLDMKPAASVSSQIQYNFATVVSYSENYLPIHLRHLTTPRSSSKKQGNPELWLTLSNDPSVQKQSLLCSPRATQHCISTLHTDPLVVSLQSCTHMVLQQDPAHCRRQTGPLTSPSSRFRNNTEPKVTLRISALRQEPDTGPQLFPCHSLFHSTVLLFANINERLVVLFPKITLSRSLVPGRTESAVFFLGCAFYFWRES